MKELSEYKAEIFRRSEERIRARKRRRMAALGIGVPLCLCAVVTLTLLTSGGFLQSKNSAAPEFAPDAYFDMVQEDCDLNCSPVQVYHVSGEAADRLLLLLESDTLSKDPIEGAPADMPFYAIPDTDDMVTFPCRLELKTSDGQTLVFRISQQQAFCETTNQTYPLTPWQLQHFSALLAVSLP